MKSITIKRTKKLVIMALFCALAMIGMNFRINVMFLSYDLKDAFITIGAMFLGPVAGIVMSAVVALLEFVTISDTGPYGLIMNFISSAAFASVAPLIYRYRRKMSGAIMGLVSSAVFTVAIMMLANLVVTPYFMGTTISEVITLIPALLLPFNAVKCTLNASLVLMLYKPAVTALRASGLLRKSSNIDSASRKSKILTTVAVALISALMVALCLAVFITVMKGSFDFT